MDVNEAGQLSGQVLRSVETKEKRIISESMKRDVRKYFHTSRHKRQVAEEKLSTLASQQTVEVAAARDMIERKKLMALERNRWKIEQDENIRDSSTGGDRAALCTRRRRISVLIRRRKPGQAVAFMQ